MMSLCRHNVYRVKTNIVPVYAFLPSSIFNVVSLKTENCSFYLSGKRDGWRFVSSVVPYEACYLPHVIVLSVSVGGRQVSSAPSGTHLLNINLHLMRERERCGESRLFQTGFISAARTSLNLFHYSHISSYWLSSPIIFERCGAGLHLQNSSYFGLISLAIICLLRKQLCLFICELSYLRNG